MSRRFLGALSRRDLSGIRRALFLEPLLQRNSGQYEALRPEEIGKDVGEGESGAQSIPGLDGDVPDKAPVPSDTMMLPKPPPMP